ncbi:endo-1,4-beta-xylanase [Adhaeretor mobilis]|uniref:Beta-xylanase n=1 Tax=Adhaeretor mobilis TaxID=1930276 RepID=A0A517MT71_9BACT|nr:endo-1,4-beta-xylanase [Adhaeretor mobilis]QDS98075.1 Endo-1,4-beta-xylanase A precursor [Adhaeretor mobilis]
MCRWSRCALLLIGSGLLAAASARPASATDIVLSDFNSTGFNYTFSGFSQSIGATSVTLSDPVDDIGGAGLNLSSPLDLSSFADGRIVVDMFTNPGNSGDQFLVELVDSAGITGKWGFDSSSLGTGTPGTLVASTTLANPTSSVGNFQQFDFTNVTKFQVLGTYGSLAPFDMSFDRVLISDTVTAPPAYAGAEPDAPWRAVADARIAANRMDNIQVNVKDALGNTLSGANVSVEMTEHEFGFGSAVVGFRLRDNNPSYATYKQKTAELFNIATLENNLKWPPWDGEWGNLYSQTGAQDAVNWLASNSIDVRGHTMVWPGYDVLPNSIQNLLDQAPLNAAQQTQLRNAVSAHIADVGGAFAGQLSAWDVINEVRVHHDIMDNLPEGDAVMIDWFTQAMAADPAAKLFLNDYGILDSSGATNTANQQLYFDTLEYLQNNGAPIDGVGFQAHFAVDDTTLNNDLTGPEQLWTIFDRFEQLGLDMQITEFDINTTNQQLQADYTRDFLTAVFAHEGMDDFVMWGFWEGAHWRPNAAMFNQDWSIKPNGQAFLDLVYDEWWTDEDLIAADGSINLDGFKGEYEVTIMLNGQEQTVTATLTEGGLVLDVALSLLSADFDGNGDVDAADLATWQGNYATASGAIQPQGDADGNTSINGLDFLTWQTQYGDSAGALSNAVPEPSGLLLGLLVVGAMGRSRRLSTPY